MSTKETIEEYKKELQIKKDCLDSTMIDIFDDIMDIFKRTFYYADRQNLNEYRSYIKATERFYDIEDLDDWIFDYYALFC